jgi:hypothetical protein
MAEGRRSSAVARPILAIFLGIFLGIFLEISLGIFPATACHRIIAPESYPGEPLAPLMPGALSVATGMALILYLKLHTRLTQIRDNPRGAFRRRARSFGRRFQQVSTAAC